MSLDFTIRAMKYTEVCSENITHNLGRMAAAAGIYKHLWRPEELGIKKARDLIEPLERGLELLRSDYERFADLEPSNGWGTYGQLCEFVSRVLEAARAFPDGDVEANP